MNTVSIHEAKAHLSALISTVERLGEPVLICRHGRPVAELGPVSKGGRITPDPTLKRIKIKCDPTEPTEAEWSDV